MNPLLPILPAVILGGMAFLLKDRLRWWAVPLLVFFATVGYQVFLIFSRFSVPVQLPPDVTVTMNVDYGMFILPVFLTSLYFSLLSLVFVLVGVGIERFLGDKLDSELLRFMVATYITLLLLQLWVEVFPWTLLVPLRFYSSFR